MLASGTRLGPYEILAPIGAGGMGEVYRARDTRLDRQVAVKVLANLFAADADRLARFEREAKALAALNHPHIAQIYGFEQSGTVSALVMELVEGEDLAERLARGAMPLDEALPVATQLAEALEAAHEQGIVHRDLKPANVKLRPDGTVKVLDFGLAKAVPPEADAANSPTFTVAATELGVIVGTAAYMAPEQARGKAVDKRADIWAFGCVLYEMLAGRAVFRGETVSDLLASIMRDAPAMAALPPTTPDGVRRLIARCLQKDPKDRLRDIADARWYLEDTAPAGAPPAALGARQRYTMLTLAATTLLALGAAAWGWSRPMAAPSPLMKVIVPAPELSRVFSPVLAPTGDRIAFVGDGRLWVRLLADQAARPIAGTDGAVQPFWSPDGRRVGYFVGPRVFTVPVDGGSPSLVAQTDRACAVPACAGSWTDDGRILLSPGFGAVYAVSERGGAVTVQIPAGEGDHHHEVWAFAGGRGALVTVDPDEGTEWVGVWDGRTRRKLVDDAMRGVYAPSGHVVFTRRGELWAIPFSLDRFEATGDPFPIAQAASDPSVSRDGTLLYVAAGRRDQHLAWIDRAGSIRESVDTSERAAVAPDVAPDGRRVAFVSRAGGAEQIWITEPGRGVRAPLLREALSQGSPAWDSDGAVYYVATAPGQLDAEHQAIHRARPGSAASTVIVRQGTEPSVSRDGRYLTFTTGDAAVRRIEYVDLREATPQPKAFAAATGIAGSACLSPDGRWIAFVQGDWTSGQYEVYVSSFPDGGDKAQVSNGGIEYHTQIRWSPRGDRLFYVRNADGSLMEATVTLADGVQLSPPRALFAESTAKVNLSAGFAVSPDGSQFLVVRESVPHGAEAGGFMLVRNWIEDFR